VSDWIKEGQPAPDFALPNQEGREVRLSDLRGRPVVLYFYPRDNTPGCTREACAFRDRQRELETAGAVVLGISPDSVASHARFHARYNLNFDLLADADHAVAERYGAWREKTRFGRKSMGIQRSTFLIDARGKVRRVWKQVQVDGHDQEVLAALKELAGDPAGAPGS
jgi:peroxiredoxin Q/BCP